MLKIYGSEMCPDCVACKYNFDKYKIEYEFLDINKNLRILKEFLKLRDSLHVFDRLKAIGDIGLPAIVKEDGEVFTDWETYMKKLGYEVIDLTSMPSCSIDHKGC